MSNGAYRVGVAMLLFASFALAQAGPKLNAVEPSAGKVGMNCTITGENLGKDSVEGVLLSDDEKDYPAEVLEQAADKLVVKIPDVKAGGYNISVKVGNNIYIQPVRFTVEQ
jgi:hypothetical protein